MKTKLLLLLILLVSFNGYAAKKYYEGTVFYTDGSMRKGFVESVLGGYVYFKSAANAKAEKLDAELLSAVTLNIKGRTKEYHRLKIYLGGKESTRISDYYMWLL